MLVSNADCLLCTSIDLSLLFHNFWLIRYAQPTNSYATNYKMYTKVSSSKPGFHYHNVSLLHMSNSRSRRQH